MGNPGKSGNEEYSSRSEIQELIAELDALHKAIVTHVAGVDFDAIHEDFRQSARNLMHYLALRQCDRRSLQMRLASLGLSSLGRAEAHVLATLDAVLSVLRRLRDEKVALAPREARISFVRGQALLHKHTEAVLGPEPCGRKVRVMVTMPTEAADNYSLVYKLLAAGMDCMRINCAHDDSEQWLQMIRHLRRAEKEIGRSCRIAMDMAGPKFRTGPIEPGPAVMKIRPVRDEFGMVVEPAHVWLTAEPDVPSPAGFAETTLSLPCSALSFLENGDKVRFFDARNARRVLDIVDAGPHGCMAELSKTAYIIPGQLMRCEGRDGTEHEFTIGEFPGATGCLRLCEGDELVLMKGCLPGKPAQHDEEGRLLAPAMIGCTLPEALDNVRAGEPVWFDDGKIGGVVEECREESLLLRITQTAMGGSKLRADKGVNFPQSDLGLEALTPKDLEDLELAAHYADIVELSFANSVADVMQLQRHLMKADRRQPAIVLKIETRKGFDNLPGMLLAAMRWPACGVMIARGDLAVECGFERMAEAQEEILWICEAAHVPVIWATQVLETLAKKGMPSRAEITDAAMGDRAECVMLNKGPHIVHAVEVLDDILRRMQAHQSKKCAMLRELHLAHNVDFDALSRHASEHP